MGQINLSNSITTVWKCSVYFQVILLSFGLLGLTILLKKKKKKVENNENNQSINRKW